MNRSSKIYSMNRNMKIGMIVAGAAAGYALYRYYSLPKDKRDQLIADAKQSIDGFIHGAGETVEKLEHYVDDLGLSEQWKTKLTTIRNLFSELYKEKEEVPKRILLNHPN